ncbi:MAG: hypothetical protein A2445_01600 [Candidatus Jacksonbacteria bacterium RIFOXYC2_FULL_44_29]|nr:MAG: hypothetical protein UW45_C0024G0007 [Parcubacteria group bacterium GW2011_GWC2_44_22]OGY75071.1 MAG: hypothetical protein A2240_00690 [Candidatus Jacksonbacteria bacterium RIFOXYA2_FULL_43_12]OGY77546.1 MAG: hypothetical protein A2295_05370 [Candidatus Jacksonbacteria bacterium RIFOXYB2_FULL_44_15]OGY79964.1 MAG: hypothetical protein A2550_05495 [Candidatus Jacksonbacteria bacterium RIFOXYD2_FULL_43_21]OGY80348.1 MAG: hypothetical protein A2445_01600 [Candidatus Jacksonbacteria bacteri
MDKQIDLILQDLYRLDPSLKQYDGQLRPLVNELIAARPQAVLDEKFRRELRVKILERVAVLKVSTRGMGIGDQRTFWSKFNPFLRPAAYVVLGVMIGAVVIIPMLTRPQPKPWAPSEDGLPIIVQKDEALDLSKLALESSITSVAPGSFGSLSNSQSVASAPALGESAATGRGGGGGVADQAPKTTSSIYPAPPDIVVYKYVYQGEELKLPAGSLPVLKRIKSKETGEQLLKEIKNVKLGLFDLNNLSAARVDNITLTEDRPLGYSLTINLLEGTLGLFENNTWRTMPVNGVYPEMSPIPMTDVPTDAQLVTLTDAFLKDYGFDLSLYGPGVVDNNWRLYSPQPVENYVPEALTVTYPLIIDGQKVYGSGGEVSGLTVNYNLRPKKVSAAWNVKSLQYQASDYPVESDVSRLLKVAEQGGLYNYYAPPDQSTKLVEIKLGAPELGYLESGSWQDEIYSELLVPAWIFPITEVPTGANVWQKRIVVPLISQILDQNSGGNYPSGLLKSGSGQMEAISVPTDKIVQ